MAGIIEYKMYISPKSVHMKAFQPFSNIHTPDTLLTLIMWMNAWKKTFWTCFMCLMCANTFATYACKLKLAPFSTSLNFRWKIRVFNILSAFLTSDSQSWATHLEFVHTSGTWEPVLKIFFFLPASVCLVCLMCVNTFAKTKSWTLAAWLLN